MYTYDELYDEIYEGTYFDHVREKVAGSQGLEIIGFKKDMRRQVVARNAHSGTGFGPATQGGNYNTGRGGMGDSIIETQGHFAVNIRVTKEERIFAIQGPDGEMDITDIQDTVKAYIDDAVDKIDQDIADVFNNGFGTTYTNVYGQSVTAVCPDGQALFSNAHTLPNADGSTTTFSNLVNDGSTDNPALSRPALVNTIAVAGEHMGANGILRPVELDTLYVGTGLYDEAVRIVESDKVSGSNNNDTNSSIKQLKVVKWARLGFNGRGVQKNTQYFLADSKKLRAGAIKFHSAQMIEFGKSKEGTENQDWVYPMDAFYTISRNQPQFIYGSTGVN